MRVRPQAVLHEKNVMQRGNNRESKCGAQEDGAGNPHPPLWPQTKQHDKENGRDLRKSVCLSENTGLEVAQSRDRKQHRTGRQDRNIAAENQYRKLPWNPVQDGEYEKQSAQQQFIRDGIEILAE